VFDEKHRQHPGDGNGMTTFDQTENCRAVIDIGSNSVKLLIADVAGGEVTPLLREGEQTRLGRGVFETGLLQPAAIEETTRAATAFATKAREHGATQIRVLATSAARDAANCGELTGAMAAAGLKLEIISGEAEAELVLCGVRSHPDFAKGPLAIIDVGGGSTELLVVDDKTLQVQHSFQLGTVRWLEKNPPSDPPTDAERDQLVQALDGFLEVQIGPLLGEVPLPDTLVGTGGTSVFLARILKKSGKLSAEELESLSISMVEVRDLSKRLWVMTMAERRQLPGLPANRADVILFGATIYEAVMRRCGFSKLRPSLRGVRHGALLS
jgi:exopolyphosphatase/guanosine-5'-triphosphate,3'-diphosphate pyrophosphatase